MDEDEKIEEENEEELSEGKEVPDQFEDEEDMREKIEEKMKEKGIDPEDIQRKIEQSDQKGEFGDLDMTDYRRYLAHKNIEAPVLVIGFDKQGQMRFAPALPDKTLTLSDVEKVIETARENIESLMERIKSQMTF